MALMEILNILCEFQDSRLYVVDFVKNRFGDLSVDYLLENEKPVLDLKERTFRFGNFKDSRMIIIYLTILIALQTKG